MPRNGHMQVKQVLKIDEFTTPQGDLASVHLEFDESELVVVAAECRMPVRLDYIEAVMCKFGGPLDPLESVHSVATLDLGAAGILRHVRHLSGYDVVARDYLLHEQKGVETRCCLAITVAGALMHLGRAALQSKLNVS